MLPLTRAKNWGISPSPGLAGGIGLIGAILFAAHVYLGLGEGGMERVAAYPQTIWLIGFGLYMTRDHYSGGRPWDARKATASASRSS